MTKVECQDLFQVAKCGCNSTNSFMRTVYCGKLWLTRAEAENAVYNGWNMADTFILRLEMGILVHVFWKTEQQSMGLFVHQIIPFLSAQEAFGSCSAISAQNGWALYYVRPKIHMFCHLLPLGSRVSVGPLQYAIYFQFSSMCEIAEATNGVCAWTTLCRNMSWIQQVRHLVFLVWCA